MDSDMPGAKGQSQSKLKTGTMVGTVAGNTAGIAFVVIVFILAYKLKKKKRVESRRKQEANTGKDNWSVTSSSSESKGFSRWSCLKKRGEYEEESDTTTYYTEEHEKKGTLVTVDGEKQLELETLLKASAYILGATGSSIMYKAELGDGTSLAVRRIDENSVDRFRDFENQVQVIAKLVHPNLVGILGF